MKSTAISNKEHLHDTKQISAKSPHPQKITRLSESERTKILNRYMSNLFYSRVASADLSKKQSPEDTKSEAYRLLKEARLTINFNVSTMLEALRTNTLSAESLKIKNCYELDSSHIDDLRQHNNYYLRHNVEARLFEYKTILQKSIDDTKASPNPKALILDNKEFDPSLRPKYGALDFLYGPYGAAFRYGKSFFELREHMKYRCTFTADDSLRKDYKNLNECSTMFDFSKIITLLDKESNEALSMKYKYAPPDSYDNAFYIEAQIHGEIDILRDVKCIHLDKEALEKASVSERDLSDFIACMKQKNVNVKIVQKPVRVKISTSTEVMDFDVQPTITIKELKQLILDKAKLSSDQSLCLMYYRDELEDSQTVQQYNKYSHETIEFDLTIKEARNVTTPELQKTFRN